MSMSMWRIRLDWLHTFHLRCVLCESEEETPAHLFFRCDFSERIWKKVQAVIGNPVVVIS